MVLNLLRIEFSKLSGYRTFWILTGLYLLVMGFGLYIFGSFKFDYMGADQQNSTFDMNSLNIYSFPDIWQNVTYVAAYFKFFLAILVVIVVANEYEYRTLRQNIIDGWSRTQFFTAKLLVISSICLTATILLLLLILILGIVHTQQVTFGDIFHNAEFILAFFLELFGFMVFVFFITILVKKAAFALGIYLFYAVVVEPIVAIKYKSIAEYLPLCSMGNLVQNPFMKMLLQPTHDYVAAQDVMMSLLYITLFSGITWYILQKRDL